MDATLTQLLEFVYSLAQENAQLKATIGQMVEIPKCKCETTREKK